MREALETIYSNLIKRITFRDEASFLRDGGVLSGGYSFSNGILTLDGTDGKATIPIIRGLNSIRIRLKANSTTENIIKLSSSHSISVSAGTVSATGFTSPTIYIDGEATSTLTTSSKEILITTATAFNADDIQLGYISSYFDGDFDLLEIFNRVITSSEAKNLYEDKWNKEVSSKDLLLDFDSTQGSIKDRTGRNTLHPIAVSIKKIGQSYSADFSGTTSRIDTGSDFIGTKAITVCGWINPKGWGGGNFGAIIDNNKLMFRISTTNSRLYFSSNSGIPWAFAANNSVYLNKLQFVVVTRSSTGVVNFYIGDKNTAPALLGTANQNSGTPAAGTTNVFIGNNGGVNRGFDGSIPMLKVFEGILDLETITNIWSSTRKNYI